jgi:hypothetical protein
MSTSVLICLFLRRDNLVDGLKMLAPFDTGVGGACNGLYWVGTTPIKEITGQFSGYMSLINTPKVEMDRLNTPQCTLVKDGIEVTICFSPWLQELFHISPYDHHMAVTLAFCNTRNLSFLPSDHPSLEMLQFVTKTLRPIVGWGVGEDIYNYDYSYHLPVWREVRPYILGSLLSTKVKEVVDLDDPSNGLFYCKNLGDNIYWLAGPGTMEMAHSSHSVDPVIFQRHIAIEKKIEEILKIIPASILG